MIGQCSQCKRTRLIHFWKFFNRSFCCSCYLTACHVHARLTRA